MNLESLTEIAQWTVRLLGGVDRDLTRTGDYLSYSNVIDQIQAAYRSMTDQGREFNRQELLNYYNVECDLTTRRLDMRWNSRRGTIVGLFTRPQSGPGSEEPTEREWRAFYRKPQDGWELVNQPEWNVVRSNIYLMGNTTQRTWRLWILAQPGDLNQGTVTSATANAIVLPASPTYGNLTLVDDAYAGNYLKITSGPGAETVVRVTAWDAATRTATCAPLQGDGDAFTTLPTSSSGYSFLTWFPTEYNDALAHLAATRMKKIDLSEDVRGDAAAKMADFTRFVTVPDHVSPFRVTDLGNQPNNLMRGGPGTAAFTGIPAGFVW